MNEMQVFDSEQFGEIRTVKIDGEPWFVAADVCRALELTNVTKVVSRLDDDTWSNFQLGQVSENGVYQRRDVSVVNEPGLYTLIFRSNKPEAKVFRRWITHEVLPSIRRTGGYGTDATVAALTTALRDAQAENERLKRLTAQRRAARLPAASTSAAESARDYMDTLNALLASGELKVCPVREFPRADPGEDVIGVEDDDYLYVLPTASYRAVAQRLRHEGRMLGGQRAVYRGLKELGLVATDLRTGGATRVKRVNGSTVRLLWLVRDDRRTEAEDHDV